MDKKTKKAITEVVQILFGTGLFGLAVNQLILPFGLYNTGFLGIAQVIVSILTDVTRIYRGSFDLVSPIFLMINIPAFLLGLFLMGKKFMVKTIFATIMYSVWMMILPAPEHAIVSDPLTACLLGGILTGIGVGIVLTTGAARISWECVLQSAIPRRLLASCTLLLTCLCTDAVISFMIWNVLFIR